MSNRSRSPTRNSIFRPTYDLATNVTGVPIFLPGGVAPTQDLRGSKRLPKSWTIRWPLFFDMGEPFQRSRQINTRLSAALFSLPGREPAFQSLALLNLMRRQALRMPSGQAVVRHLKRPELTPEQLGDVITPTPLWSTYLRRLRSSRVVSGFATAAPSS
jgi:hypothetical protein